MTCKGLTSVHADAALDGGGAFGRIGGGGREVLVAVMVRSRSPKVLSKQEESERDWYDW